MTPDPMSRAPLTADEVRARLAGMAEHDLPTHGGRTLAYVYDSGRAQVDALAAEALAAYGGTNGLDPTAFPSLAMMERDVLGFAAAALDAPAGWAGAVTSGGTESCLLAVLAARDGAAAIERPQIVAPATVHAAFHKAAHLFGVELVLVDVDPGTFRADAAAMAAALTDRTVLVVVSAPSYAHGVIDPVTQVAAAAAERGIRCHVDACIGGFVLPFLPADPTRPAWTFAVPGVTSISADLHKYGYAPKGASILLHRTAALRRSHVYATAEWPGYAVINPTLQSTRSGGPLAAAWATVQLLGHAGYADLAAAARAACLAVVRAVDGDRANGLPGIPGLRVVVQPDSSLVALATDASCDPYTVCDELLARGWYAQPQLPFRGGPATIHLTMSAATAGLADELVSALAAAAAVARERGPVTIDAGMAAVLAGLDPAALDEAAVGGLLALAGLAGGDGAVRLPDRMAPIHALLAACPPPVRSTLLVAVLERL
jgi:sphinganine-1-phosphate aldolase